MKRIRRQKSHNAVGRLYKVKAGIYNPDRYYDEGWTYYRSGYHTWSRKYDYFYSPYKMREFRTWKHTRKTQWKS